ncbi:MAG: ImmA/IrrE family metallo-endopeptidase [Lachnospiraceae bacterium]|nr:ImmA/IrrE family metallo-endopeptidase [Lachnospiraceae bacterium]
MKRLATNEELETLGNLMVREYLTKSHKWNAKCFDIEAFITDYLKVTIEFETFAEEDAGKTGFRANGVDPLTVLRNGKKEAVVFPKDTIVIEKFFLGEEQSAKRRFTQAHEAAHVILSRHIPGQTAAAFHSEFDSGREYAKEDLKRIFSLEESQADRLGAVLLMPQYHVDRALKKFNEGRRFIRYEGGIFGQGSKFRMQNMADCLGASYSALVNRLNDLELFEDHPIQEYLEQGLGFGGA